MLGGGGGGGGGGSTKKCDHDCAHCIIITFTCIINPSQYFLKFSGGIERARCHEIG